ncbi:MAG: efflux RND transporter periplasmic adaptor subunit [Akkermansiaceae bacterium]
MTRLTTLPLIPALLAAASHAGEITIEPRPFVVAHSFAATALPGADCVLVKLDPRSWSDFKILELAAHGSRVVKDEILIRFDPVSIDQKLEDARRALATSRLALAQAEQSSKHLHETAPHKLDGLRRAAEIARDEHAYFTQTRRKAAEGSAAQSLKRSQQILANQREELKQLTRMYEADDITEETEEIILVRQQDAVASAEFALRMEVLNHKRTLEVSLPREAKTLADSERDTAISLAKGEIDIPRSLELDQLALAALTTAHAREKETLADLEYDRKKFEFKAPAAGWFYYGAIEDGKWSPSEVVKSLTVNGRPSTTAAFATFVPAAAEISLISFVDEGTARALALGLTGYAILAGREDLEIPVKVTSLAATPGPDGKFRADLAATWPEGHTPAPGSTAEIRLISYQQPAAIAVSGDALQFGADGWTVEIKLADGKTERRPVKRGRVTKDETEILSGLEIGQVIVTPDK